MKNKSFARKAVMIAGLTAGIAGMSSIFNEAAASGSCTAGRPLMKSNKGNYCCNGQGTDCCAACC